MRYRSAMLLVAGLLLALAIGAGVVLTSRWPSSISWTVLVLQANGTTTDFRIAFPIGERAGTVLELVDQNTTAWYGELLNRFPVPSGANSTVEVVVENGTWLRASTDTTLVVGISWIPRVGGDNFPFGGPAVHARGLDVVTVPAAANVSLAALGFTTFNYFLSDRSDVAYFLTSAVGIGPSGAFEGALPGYLLANFMALVPIDSSGAAPLVWGNLEFTYRE